MAARDLTDEGEPEPAPLSSRGRLGAEAFLEDLAVGAIRNAGSGIVDPDHKLVGLLRHRYAHPPIAGRRRSRV